MRILHVSDIHCSTSSAELIPSLVSRHEADVIVVSGDLECDDYILDRLLEAGVPVIGVPGNMDDSYVSRAMSERGINIDASIVEVSGVLFAGVGGRTPLSSLRKIEGLLREAKRGEIVVVSHHPPHGTRIDIARSGVHAGLHELRGLLEEHQPLACLCGHIHESPGVDRIGKTLIVNPGPFYRGRYAVVSLEHLKAELHEAEIGC